MMKKFIIKVLIFLLSFFILEKIFLVFLLISPELEKDTRLQKILDGNINKDLIVLGSSRGARNIIAGQIEDSLNISSFNLSYPGADIEFQEFIFRSLLKFNEAPGIVLLVVDDPSLLLPSESLIFRLDRLYPLAKYNHINNEMISRNEKNILSKIFVLARINKRNFDIRKKHFTALDSIKVCGSMPVSFRRKDRNMEFIDRELRYDNSREVPDKVNAFNEIQRLSKLHNITLYIVYPPNYTNHNDLFEKRIRQLSSENTLHYVYDYSNEIYRDKEYFYDEGHLTINGAVIFTNEIINELKKNNPNVKAKVNVRRVN